MDRPTVIPLLRYPDMLWGLTAGSSAGPDEELDAGDRPADEYRDGPRGRRGSTVSRGNPEESSRV